MKQGMVLALTAFALLVMPAYAAEQLSPELLEKQKQPIVMGAAAHPRMHVLFKHVRHKKIDCGVCHHMEDFDGNIFVSCSSEGCHADKDRKSREIDSYFMAMHNPESDHSCLGCHKAEEPNNRRVRDLGGCHTCHNSRVMTYYTNDDK